MVSNFVFGKKVCICHVNNKNIFFHIFFYLSHQHVYKNFLRLNGFVLNSNNILYKVIINENLRKIWIFIEHIVHIVFRQISNASISTMYNEITISLKIKKGNALLTVYKTKLSSIDNFLNSLNKGVYLFSLPDS